MHKERRENERRHVSQSICASNNYSFECADLMSHLSLFGFDRLICRSFQVQVKNSIQNPNFLDCYGRISWSGMSLPGQFAGSAPII